MTAVYLTPRPCAPPSAEPIPNQQGALPVEEFIGRPAVPHPVSAKPIPANPAMDEAPGNNFHDDTSMSPDDDGIPVGARGQRE